MTAVPPLHTDALSGLRVPYVRRFALGRMAAVMGSQIVNTAVGYELYERTHDAWALGLVGLVELIPVLLLMLPAGHASDRFARRNIAIAAHTLLCVTSLGLAFVSIQGASVGWVYALLSLIGVARAFSSPSVGTILPQLVGAEQLVNANAWLSSSFELASISGPAVAGLLIAWSGHSLSAYVAAAVGQLGFVAMLATLPRRDPPPRTQALDRRELFAGFRFVRKQPIFLAAITLDLFAVLLGGAVALLPVFAKDVLHVGPVGLGWLRAAPSIGAFSMSLLTTRLPPWKRPGHTLLLAVAGFGLATIGFGLSRDLTLSLVCLFFTGVFDAVSVVVRVTLEQMITPDHLRGRVSAINFVFIGFSNELGSFESGATAALFGPVASVVGGGIGTLLVVATVTLLWPALKDLPPLSQLKPSDDPDTA